MNNYGFHPKIKSKNVGKLHEDLGVAIGTKIPDAQLQDAKNSTDPAERKRAIFALNARAKKNKYGVPV